MCCSSARRRSCMHRSRMHSRGGECMPALCLDLCLANSFLDSPCVCLACACFFSTSGVDQAACELGRLARHAYHGWIADLRQGGAALSQ